MKSKIMIAVMSYNRGIYLKNCIKSIEKHIKDKDIYIFDDNSECFKTKKILKILSRKYPVKINKRKGMNKRLKGLYQNMNLALNIAKENKYEYLFIIQDDVQVIRKWDKRFYNECNMIFNFDKKIIQISTLFYKKMFSNKHQISFVKKFYYMKNKNYGLADIGIMRVKTLKEINWKWYPEKEEFVHRNILHKEGYYSVLFRDPNIMFTPWPETYRNNISKRSFKNFLIFLSDKLFNAGFHPYKEMSNEKINKLLSRDIREIPYAEDYLETYTKLKKPWLYTTSINYFVYHFVKFANQLGFKRNKKGKIIWKLKL